MDSLNTEEKEILESVEQEEWISVPDLDQEIERYQRYFQAHLGKMKEMNLNIPKQDWEVLKQLAEETGTSIPILVANILHRYVSSYNQQQLSE